jgi:hypothetical protein
VVNVFGIRWCKKGVSLIKKKGMIVRRVEANDHLVNVTNATHDKVTSLDLLYVSSTKDSEFQLAMRQRFSPSDPFMVMYF